MSMFERLKGAAGGVATWASGVYDNSVQKLQETVVEVQAASPVIQQVGFRVTDIEMEVSLSPRVVLHLVRERLASEEEFQAALANYAQRKTIWTILKALQQANVLTPRVAPAGRPLKALELEMGLPPALRFRFGEAVPTSTTSPA